MNPITVNLISELKSLYKIAIRHDGTGVNPDWHLDRIALTMIDPKSDKEQHETPIVFYFNQWILANKIYEAGCDNMTPSTYTIRVSSTSPTWAGTNGDVFINIIGDTGRTQMRKLPFYNTFADAFKVNAVDLGELQYVILYNHKQADWTVSTVEVEGPNGNVFTFTFDDQNITQDGTISCQLLSKRESIREPDLIRETNPIEEPHQQSLNHSTGHTKLQGLVVTSDLLGAGADGKVQMWFTDSRGVTVGPVTVREADDNAMERGQESPISVTLSEELIDLYKVSITQNGTLRNDK